MQSGGKTYRESQRISCVRVEIRKETRAPNGMSDAVPGCARQCFSSLSPTFPPLETRRFRQRFRLGDRDGLTFDIRYAAPPPIARAMKSQGTRSGERGGHVTSPFRGTGRSGIDEFAFTKLNLRFLVSPDATTRLGGVFGDRITAYPGILNPVENRSTTAGNKRMQKTRSVAAINSLLRVVGKKKKNVSTANVRRRTLQIRHRD